MIESIERDSVKVILRINTGLERIEKRILKFEYEAGHEIYAELLKDQLWEQLDKFKKQIVQTVLRYPRMYLSEIEVSKLKSMLVKEWNGSKHCWK